MRTWRGLAGLVIVALVSYRAAVGGPRPSAYFWSFEFAGQMALVFVGFFFFFVWLQRRGSRDCLEGSALMGQGRLEEALVLLSRAVDRSPRIAAFEYARASCLLQMLRVEEAEKAFLSARRKSQPKVVRDFYAGPAQLALALQGKQPAALEGPDSAERTLVRAVELVRKGEWQPALEQLASPSQQMLWGTTRVLKEALSAWCEEKVGGERRSVDLTLLRQPGVAEVRSFWPELAEQLSQAGSAR